MTTPLPFLPRFSLPRLAHALLIRREQVVDARNFDAKETYKRVKQAKKWEERKTRQGIKAFNKELERLDKIKDSGVTKVSCFNAYARPRYYMGKHGGGKITTYTIAEYEAIQALGQ